ncbi:uncharacterized protein LOC131675898 [Topomyia yanbarensis]|uniref:uncharacterized protein LOC131675898 n=1 Tax=Topomyia yanbarensis TaxID=2498891 RepID=UPI00273AD699|nr:uncharacterized protein LOC131675898 [Topomyia yanbarensis]
MPGQKSKNKSNKTAGTSMPTAGAKGTVAITDTTASNTGAVTINKPLEGVPAASTNSDASGNALNKVSARRSKRNRHCLLCNEPDNSRMVQCDSCDSWYHFTCANVTEAVAETEWSCPSCGTNNSTNPPHADNVRSPEHQSIQHHEQSEDIISVLSNNTKTSSSTSTRISRSRRAMKLQLRKLAETKALEQRFLEMKFDILNEYRSESEEDDVGLIVDKVSQVEEWIKDTDRIGDINEAHFQPTLTNRQQPISSQPVQHIAYGQGQPPIGYNGAGTSQAPFVVRNPLSNLGGRSMPHIDVQPPGPAPHNLQWTRPTVLNRRVSGVDNFVPEQGSTPNPPRYRLEPMENNGDHTVFLLNRSQLAARHAVPKDLPEFSGQAEEWPLFLAMFNSSTQMCGFSNEENMLRLRKCLRGEALNRVRCELLHPSNVTSVMSTLKMLYGKPEAIIQAVIQKVRDLPAPKVEKLETLVDFALSVKNLCATIQACEISDYMYSSSLRYELVERLPPGLKLEWARATRGNVVPTLLEFSTWLYTMAEDASAVIGTQNNVPRDESKFRSRKENVLNVHIDSDKKQAYIQNRDKQNVLQSCSVCKGNCSSVAKCEWFAEFSYDSRWATIKELKLCRKCLQRHNSSCRQKRSCGINGCTYLHHPLLHNSKRLESEATTSGSLSSLTHGGNLENSVNIHQARTSGVLFRFVPVVLYGPSKEVHTYAFIDDGSELTLLEQGLADELGVSGQIAPLCLKWTGGTKRVECESQKVSLEISGTSNQSRKHALSDVRTVNKLELRPQTMIISELIKRYRHLAGLPIESYHDTAPRILIGVDHAKLGHVTKSREGKTKEPVAVKTCLGWCVYGYIAQSSSSTSVVNHHMLDICPCNQENGEYLHKAMKEYFSLDSMGVVKPEKLLVSTEDERALQMLDTLTRRKGDRYESGLLWKYDSVRLPNNKTMALKRWECLEHRMQNDPKLAEVLNTKIADYISKGYIRKLTDVELTIKHPRIWYLPVFPVVNPNKPTKTRLVWDAAAKVHGVSLNSVLLKGPDFLTSLLSVLIQFREHRIAVCGDLREMYHQVLMREEDQHSQRFFWGREESLAKPTAYVMQVMTFGACCSPSIAQYVKNRHAKLYANKFPAAVHAIVKQHYVDDMLISVETEEEAISIVRDVKMIHQKGGFEMRNWLSNSPTVLTSLNEKPVAKKNLNVSDGLPTEKILGMWWDTEKDCFTFKLSTKCPEDLLSGRRRPTKREALRILMLMYDPCGFIAHFLMYLKVLLQDIWRSGIGWNDSIGENEFEKWLLWVKVLPKIEDVEIPRCFRNLASVHAEIQLHTFVDASENGFAAAVYLRFREGTKIECALVAAKTRVAPLRFLSIPRAELQAAVLGVRLTNAVQSALSLKVRRRFFYTDARDACCWLTSDHRRYSQFVAFRVSEILENTDVSEWHWISTKQNVADLGTKWKGFPDLNPQGPWFRGSSFLSTFEEEWPITSQRYGTTDEELRPHLLTHIVAPEPLIAPEKYSNWMTLLRRTATFTRQAFNWRRLAKKERPLSGPLTHEELKKTENYLYRIAQCDAFADEVAILKTNASAVDKKRIPRSSSIYRVCPTLDTQNILRVQGRTGACKYVDVDASNPIILPHQHTITKLVVAHFHRQFHHQNHETVVNELRQHFYIPRLKVVYRRVRKECQQCHNDSITPSPPLMANLTEARLAAYTRPFTHTGVDYFGPITVSIGRRTEKRWGVLATCLTTRAIHLQVAYSLSTDSCIMALRNIFSRRGTPSVIYSDRGTNFQGAEKVLEDAIRNIDQDRLMTEFTSRHTEWRFNPPATPHMGGAWERLIRTVKQNLSKVMASKVVSAEVFENALNEVENIVNSRPLTNIPVDGDFSPVLTPNHFLLQSSNGLKPFVPFDDTSRALKNNYEISQVIANSFWKQWLRDYIPTITRRSKWFTATKPIEVNDVVIIADPKFPRNCWPKGRVISTKVSVDGQVRSATVQTVSGGIYERPAVNTPRTHPQSIPGGSVDCATSTNEPHGTLFRQLPAEPNPEIAERIGSNRKVK